MHQFHLTLTDMTNSILYVIFVVLFVIDASEFNHVMKNMNIGFTDEEIKSIMEWIDADGNGELSYDECLVELSDCCINAILNRCEGKSVPEVIDALNIKHQTDYDSYASDVQQQEGGQEEATSDLSPSLEGYLKDVFMAADIDNSGQLDPTEFFNVLHTVFNMTDGDKEFLSSNWDDDGDGLISWAEALDEFNKIFSRLRDARSDYWIALIDKPTGRFFWYNVRDEHSFWMNAEDEANYHRLVTEGLERTEPIKPNIVPKKVPNSSGKLSAREIRVLQKKKAKQSRLDKQKSMASL
jgi:Ca2+-binding EF-hand superfamily protein